MSFARVTVLAYRKWVKMTNRLKVYYVMEKVGTITNWVSDQLTLEQAKDLKKTLSERFSDSRKFVVVREYEG